MNDFSRKLAFKRYKRKFWISTEGRKTEYNYFSMFTQINSTISIEVISSNHKSNPTNVYKRVYKQIQYFQKNDEVWIVIDKDNWPEDDLNELVNSCSKNHNHYLAVSNPKFEYWLLLHFEGGGQITLNNCVERLKNHLPSYKKDIDVRVFLNNRTLISTAIKNAKNRDNPQCKGWPKKTGVTTVYRLVEKLITVNQSDN